MIPIQNAIVTLHFIADWWLQPREIAVNKATSLKHMLAHLVVIHAAFSILALIYGIPQWAVCLNTVLHGVQDKIIWGSYGKLRANYEGNRFEDYWFWFCIALDQMIHINIMFYLFGVM